MAPAVYQALLLDRQGVGPVGGERYDGVDGLMRVIEQLEGVSLPLPVWEGAVFPARVRGYQPAILDELLASGDVVWTGEKTAGTKAKEPGRIAFHPADSELLINTAAADATGHPSDGAPDDTMTGDTAPDDDAGQALESVRTLPDAILHVLAAGGAFRAERLAELVRAAWRPDTESVDPETGEIRPLAWSNSQFEDALWSLVWQGAVTNSSLTPVRAMASAVSSHATRSVSVGRTRRRARVAVQVPVLMQGLWSAVPTVTATAEQRSLAQVEILLDRYGIIAPPLIDVEDVPGGFSALYPVLRRMEKGGAGEEDTQLRYRDIVMDPDNYDVSVGGENVSLTAREFEILRLLMENQGRVFSRESLLDSIWGYDYFGDEKIVNTHIKNIRRKLGGDYIETVRGVGYRIEKENP